MMTFVWTEEVLMEDVMVRARKALEGLWGVCLVHARGWGLKRKDKRNTFKGTNIILIEQNEVVIIAGNELNNDNNRVVIHEFKRVKNTILGDRVSTLLQFNQISHHRRI